MEGQQRPLKCSHGRSPKQLCFNQWRNWISRENVLTRQAPKCQYLTKFLFALFLLMSNKPHVCHTCSTVGWAQDQNWRCRRDFSSSVALQGSCSSFICAGFRSLSSGRMRLHLECSSYSLLLAAWSWFLALLSHLSPLPSDLLLVLCKK